MLFQQIQAQAVWFEKYELKLKLMLINRYTTHLFGNH